MSILFRTYRIPLATTALIVAALIFWAWLDWRSFDEQIAEKERHRAFGMSKMLIGTIILEIF